jgi:antitoxin component HigA of HigAB toxin-antitoxin module
MFAAITSSATAGSDNANSSSPIGSPSYDLGEGGDIASLAFIVMMEASKSAQADLESIMNGVKAINQTKDGWRAALAGANAAAATAGDPCKGPTASAFRQCIQALKRKMSRMEIASLDLMRASVSNAQGELMHLRDALQQAPQEVDRMRRKLPPPARPLPPSPCRGWNAGFWKDCVAALTTSLAGNLPDSASESDVRRAADALKQEIDSMSEMSEMTSLRLQMAMDRLSKLMTTLSNILRKISDTEQAITQNLK